MGKRPPKKVVAKVVANPEVDNPIASSGKSDLPLLTALVNGLHFDEIEIGNPIETVSKGWRLERNTNGYYRWRWQVKDAYGNAVTYINPSGKKSYKRGSKYVGKNPE